MTVFDAINHAMTTVSTGGYATDDLSMARFDSKNTLISVILCCFSDAFYVVRSYFNPTLNEKIFGSTGRDVSSYYYIGYVDPCRTILIAKQTFTGYGCHHPLSI